MTGRRPADAVQQIREHELEVAQFIEGARAAAEERVKTARVEARDIVEESRRKGREAARLRFEKRVAAAHQEAAQVKSNAELAVTRLREDAAPLVAEAIDAMVILLLASPEEESE